VEQTLNQGVLAGGIECGKAALAVSGVEHRQRPDDGIAVFEHLIDRLAETREQVLVDRLKQHEPLCIHFRPRLVISLRWRGAVLLVRRGHLPQGGQVAHRPGAENPLLPERDPELAFLIMGMAVTRLVEVDLVRHARGETVLQLLSQLRPPHTVLILFNC
jgi:hypothetical protein